MDLERRKRAWRRRIFGRSDLGSQGGRDEGETSLEGIETDIIFRNLDLKIDQHSSTLEEQRIEDQGTSERRRFISSIFALLYNHTLRLNILEGDLRQEEGNLVDRRIER